MHSKNTYWSVYEFKPHDGVNNNNYCQKFSVYTFRL